MISNILEMLEIAKREKDIKENTRIALGKYSIPLTIKEGYKQLKYELWEKR
jgi:hypothetical protein